MIIESQFIKHYSKIDYLMQRRKKEFIAILRDIKLEESNEKLKIFKEKFLKQYVFPIMCRVLLENSKPTDQDLDKLSLYFVAHVKIKIIEEKLSRISVI